MSDNSEKNKQNIENIVHQRKPYTKIKSRLLALFFCVLCIKKNTYTNIKYKNSGSKYVIYDLFVSYKILYICNVV